MTPMAINREERRTAKKDIIFSWRSYPSGTMSRLLSPYGVRGLGGPE